MATTNDELRSFGAFLQHLEDGQLYADLTEKLHVLNLAMLKHAELSGKARGRLMIEFSFAVEGGTVQIESSVKCREPEAARARSVTWLSKAGHLTKNNPRQTLLPLREVPPPAAPPRELEDDAADPRSV